MSAKQTLFLSFAFLVFVPFYLASAATDTELQVGKAQDGVLTSGKIDSYTLSLKPGDFVETNVVTHGTKLIITIYGPSTKKARGFRFTGQGRKIGFVADDLGGFASRSHLMERQKMGRIRLPSQKLLLSQIDPSPPPGAERYESLQIKALRTAVDSGQASAVERFWEDMKIKGAPLIEPLAGDDKNMLVMFLWKGTAATKNVMVLWFPFSLQRPDDHRMTRLGETDVWYRTLLIDKRKRFIYQLAVNAPPLRPSPEPSDGNALSLLEGASQPDPLNPKRWLVDPESPEVPEHQGVSALEMPDAPGQPWVAQRKGVPTGKIEKHEFNSALLKNNREIAVYTPPGYSKDAKPYGLLFLFDEKPYLDEKIIPTPTILDNLIADNRIPPLVTVLIDNGPGDARSRELPCNPNFADFLNFELVPWVRRTYNVTDDPQRTIVGGASYGGLAAAYAGFRHPETFGIILSQSGSYWWTPPRSDNPDDFDLEAEPNWLANQFILSPRLPLRFYMDAGSDEVDLSGRGSSILIPNRHLRDVLLAKGYEVHYQEFSGGHDFLSWRGTLADGLIVLMGGITESHPQHSTLEH